MNKGDGIALIISNMMTQPPPLDLLSDDIRPFIGRLLAQSPDMRFQTAEETLDELCAATNQPVPEETSSIRESFLHTAKLVGRERELQTLVDSLDEVTSGDGATWLIGGESGVGKSRLVDELRIRALIRGVVVLQSASQKEGGAPYLVWRNIMRSLCLSTQLTDLEASVLRVLVPDIDQLLERQIPEAPELEPQYLENRLLGVIDSVIQKTAEYDPDISG